MSKVNDALAHREAGKARYRIVPEAGSRAPAYLPRTYPASLA